LFKHRPPDVLSRQSTIFVCGLQTTRCWTGTSAKGRWSLRTRRASQTTAARTSGPWNWRCSRC